MGKIDDVSVTSPTDKITAQNKVSAKTQADLLKRAAGNWYDSDGNLVLSIQDNAINSCPVQAGYDFAGSPAIGTGTLKLISKDTPRYIRLNWSLFAPNSKRATLVISAKGRILHKVDDDNWQYESVSIGRARNKVYLNMTKKQVEKLIGKPDKIINDNTWYYKNEGVDLNFYSAIGPAEEVTGIRVYKKSFGSSFTKSSLTCNNSLSDYTNAYKMKAVPKEKSIGVSIGHGEYLDFDDYPNSINLRSNPLP